MILENILKKHHAYLTEQSDVFFSNTQIKKVVDILNKKGIITLSGAYGVGKTAFVKQLLEKTTMLENSFYYNAQLQTNTLMSLSTLEISQKIIILENCHSLENLTDVIQKNFTLGKKIILIGNHYTLPGIPEESLYNQPNNTINKTSLSPVILNNYIHLISQDIFIEKKLKNFELLKNIIALIAQNSSLISVRELYTILESQGNSIAHITLLEYIEHFIEAKLIKKVPRYNLKNGDISTGKAKYFFTDVSFRKAATIEGLPELLIRENTVFQKLLLSGYDIYTGKNGTFDFSFLGKKQGSDIIAHVSNFSDKSEVKKEAKKLLKIPGDFTKYLVVDSIKDIGIRPSTYLPVEIIEISDFIKKESL